MFDLSGRVALVTGAGQNTGAGIARLLAARGAAVGVNDLVASRAEEVTESIRQAGGQAIAAAFDVTNQDAVRAGVEQVGLELAPVDILVNNAGVPEAMTIDRFQDTSPDMWKRFIDLNLYGVLHCTRAVIDGMCERGSGRVITISSGAGQVGLSLGVAAYGAGKGGAIAFMRHLAMEVARQGVTANTLALGTMAHVGDAEVLERVARSVPVGRLGEPEDVAAAVLFLASDESSWMTGQTIGLNGGSVTT
ncbi:MAG: SDR family oxidoreductase [Deltaproteobacteria bacterium]|nr:SDR family oxidoreductase [Deltaproteobacteria bacterium]MBW2384086.1 SDR family oxidoreductase [Deltaproteobacteria bacterium]MBW2695366.1 SDR family oxidoreductase [Deltaproteobacteria bacterium]